MSDHVSSLNHSSSKVLLNHKDKVITSSSSAADKPRFSFTNDHSIKCNVEEESFKHSSLPRYFSKVPSLSASLVSTCSTTTTPNIRLNFSSSLNSSAQRLTSIEDVKCPFSTENVSTRLSGTINDEFCDDPLTHRDFEYQSQPTVLLISEHQKWHQTRSEDASIEKHIDTMEKISDSKSRYSPNCDHTSNHHKDNVEDKIIIHPKSVEGTIAAAAWHLHGQSGGRAKLKALENTSLARNVSVMNANAMACMQTHKEYDKGFQSTARSHCRGELYADDTTNVIIAVEQENTLISAKNNDSVANLHRYNYHGFDEIGDTVMICHRDAWSTGVASAVVMGTAARYKKALCMFPHGHRVLAPIILSLMAFLLSCITFLSCRFMTILPTSSNNQVLTVGPWFYLSRKSQYTSGEICLSYPSNVELDIMFIMARSAATLATFFGAGLVLWTFTLTCISYSHKSLNGLGVCFIISSIIQLATGLFYFSTNCYTRDVDVNGEKLSEKMCSPSQDFVFCVAASALYLFTGMVLNLARRSIVDERSLNTSEIYTWSAAPKVKNGDKLVTRTVEKSWMKIPGDGVLMATVVVERKYEMDGRVKTHHTIRTEILPMT